MKFYLQKVPKIYTTDALFLNQTKRTGNTNLAPERVLRVKFYLEKLPKIYATDALFFQSTRIKRKRTTRNSQPTQFTNILNPKTNETHKQTICTMLALDSTG